MILKMPREIKLNVCVLERRDTSSKHLNLIKVLCDLAHIMGWGCPFNGGHSVCVCVCVWFSQCQYEAANENSEPNLHKDGTL